MFITLFSVPAFLTVPVRVLWMTGMKFIMDDLAGLSTRRPYFDERPVRVRNVLDPVARGLVSHRILWCTLSILPASGPSPATEARLLSFNRTQSRVVTGLLTRHNTPRRLLNLMGLSNNPPCRKCGTEEETSAHILCECEALASLIHAHLGSFFWGPEDIMNLIIRAIWNFAKGTGLLWTGVSLWGTRGLFWGLGASDPQGPEPKYYSFIFPTLSGTHSVIWSRQFPFSVFDRVVKWRKIRVLIDGDGRT
jgi:hypothetical protein